MAIAYVGGQVAGRANPSSSTSVNFALTGGLAATPANGDLVVITCVTGSSGGTPAMAVSGYTALGQLDQSAATNDTSLNVSYKRMGASPDTSFTLPGTGNNNWAEAYAIQVFRGVDPTTPLGGVSPVSAGGTGTGRPDPASITPTAAGAGAWVLICGGGAAGTGANYTAPANYTTNFLTASGADGVDAMVGCGYRSDWSSGAEDPAAYTGGTTGASDSWAAYTVVLKAEPPTHATTGVLTGGASVIAGSAARTRVHATSGALTGQAATIAGTAAHIAKHATSGALTGGASVISGSAARTRAHPTSGVLAGAGGVIDGAAARSGGVTSHDTSGALAGAGSVVDGSAARERIHPTSGALSGAGAVTDGAAARTREHPASGVLAGAGAVVDGSAERMGAAVTHETSGALAGAGAVVSGSASGSAVDGVPPRFFTVKRKERRYTFDNLRDAMRFMRDTQEPEQEEEQEQPAPKPRKPLKIVSDRKPTKAEPVEEKPAQITYAPLNDPAEIAYQRMAAEIAAQRAWIERDEDDIEALLLAL